MPCTFWHRFLSQLEPNQKQHPSRKGGGQNQKTKTRGRENQARTLFLQSRSGLPYGPKALKNKTARGERKRKRRFAVKSASHEHALENLPAVVVHHVTLPRPKGEEWDKPGGTPRHTRDKASLACAHLLCWVVHP